MAAEELPMTTALELPGLTIRENLGNKDSPFG
jgi:hypothetical protein